MLSFDALPYDILLHIALEVANVDVLGPPVHLASLLRTSRRLGQLSRDANLLAAVFCARFDTAAARRRFGPRAIRSSTLATQLKLYCVALKHIRAADIRAATLEHDLWVAYVMLTEADFRNYAHLVHYARLPAFADRLVRARLHEHTSPTGWPQDNAVNSLAVWLLWMVTDLHTLQAESHEDREQLIRLILPYVICCFRYHAFHAADIHYMLPLDSEVIQQLPLSLATLHGPYPQYPDRHAFATLTLYNQRVRLAPPFLSHAAQLLYFSRRELNGLTIPDHVPRNRAHALSLGQATGPTRADFEEFNATSSACTLPWATWDRRAASSCSPPINNEDTQQEPCQSARFDADWERLSGCYDPWNTPSAYKMYGRYTLGSMVGQWVGRMIFPEENAYRSMIQNPLLPANFSEWYPHCTVRPFMFTLREYHCYYPEEPVDHAYHTNGSDEGVLNAYLPALDIREEQDYALLTDENNIVYEYDIFTPGKHSAGGEEEEDALPFIPRKPKVHSEPQRDIEELFEEAGMPRQQMEVDEKIETETQVINPSLMDIIFLGETEARHGDAWCYYRYYGRVRDWDGLIVLVAVPLDVNDRIWGKWILRGYLHANQNFVGRWRHYAYDVYGPPYEGPFSFSKRID